MNGIKNIHHGRKNWRNIEDDAVEIEVLENVIEGRGVIDIITPRLEKTWFLYPTLLKLNLLMLAPIFSASPVWIWRKPDEIICKAWPLGNVTTFIRLQEYNLGQWATESPLGLWFQLHLFWSVCHFFGRKKALIGGCVIFVVGSHFSKYCSKF